MIKAVIFDFFGVICSDEYWNFVKEDKNMQGRFGELSDSVNLGRLSWPEFLKTVAEETGRDFEEVKKMYESEHINLQMVTYIHKLRQKYKTALLSNASESFIDELIKKARLDKVFDELIISSRVGIIKPDPRIYKYTLDKLGVEANEAVFIDDSHARVMGAARLGIHTILYENFPEFKKDLEELLAAGSNE
jgi:epoxide hydrolase-like predicted phosphatase